jgi:hypothetical protein
LYKNIRKYYEHIFRQYYIICVMFVDRCLSFCRFSFRHCIVCPSLIYGFLLPLLLSSNLFSSWNRLLAIKAADIQCISVLSIIKYICILILDHGNAWQMLLHISINLIKIRSLTCFSLPICRGVGDLRKPQCKKIKKKFCKINSRKFSFNNRIVDLWNTLPQSVIDAKDVRQFEIRLDKYWEHQDVNLSTKPASKTRKTPETTPK